MHGDRISFALTRIETAASRIRAAARPARSPATEPDLSARYETLRREAATALAELDQLIAHLET